MNNTKRPLKNAILTTLWPGASGEGGGILVVARAEGVRRKKEVMLMGKKMSRW